MADPLEALFPLSTATTLIPGVILRPVSVPDELSRLDETHRRAVWAFCYQMLGSPFEADDAIGPAAVGWLARPSA
jgi:hypothetical protein